MRSLLITLLLAVLTGCNERKQFFNSEGQPIPEHAVRLLVKAQFKVMSEAEADTLNKYFLNDKLQQTLTNK